MRAQLEVELGELLHEAARRHWEPPVAGASGPASEARAEPFYATPGVTPPAAGDGVDRDPDEATRALLRAVDQVASVQPVELSPAQALTRTKALQRARQQLEVLTLEALSDVDRRQLFTLDDQPSTRAWVDAQPVPGVDPSEVTLARRLSQVPKIADELRAARLSTAVGSRLASALAKARPFLDRPDGLIDGQDGDAALYGVAVDGVCQLVAEQVGEGSSAEADLALLREQLEELVDLGGSQAERLEAALILFALHCDPALLPTGLLLLLDALLPAEHQKRADAASDKRDFTLIRDPLGSGWRAKGTLDDEAGELLATALEAAQATDPCGASDTAAWREGREAVADDTLRPEHWPADQVRPRSAGERRHDALKRALQTLLGSGALGTRGKVAPHIAVTCSLDFVHGLPGSLPGRTRHGARLSRAQLRELLCRSTFTRFVLDARSRVVELSHTQRTSTAVERLLLTVQCGGVCQRAGCGHGPHDGHRLIPHHGDLFSRSGRTAVHDTVMLCEIDHDHELHGRGRTIRLKDGRVLGPHGWVRR